MEKEFNNVDEVFLDDILEAASDDVMHDDLGMAIDFLDDDSNGDLIDSLID